jgi:hypothetical protein
MRDCLFQPEAPSGDERKSDQSHHECEGCRNEAILEKRPECSIFRKSLTPRKNARWRIDRNESENNEASQSHSCDDGTSPPPGEEAEQQSPGSCHCEGSCPGRVVSKIHEGNPEDIMIAQLMCGNLGPCLKSSQEAATERKSDP